jgi:hypothetical protein
MGYRGGSSSPPALSGLQGVTISGASHGQLLRYLYGQWRNSNPAFSNLQIGDTDPMVLAETGIFTRGRSIDLTPPSTVPANLPAGCPLWFELTEISDAWIGSEFCPMVLTWNATLSRYEWINVTDGFYGDPPDEQPWRNYRRVVFQRVGLTNTFTVQTEFVAEEPTGSPVFTNVNDCTPSVWNGSDWIITPVSWTGSNWNVMPYGWTVGGYVNATVPALEMGGGELRNSGKVETNALVVSAGTAPAPTGTGTVGEIRWAGNYLYVCVAANTWRRASLSNWTP